MAICFHRDANLSKQRMFFDVGLPKRHACGRGLNRYVHEGMKNISSVKIDLKTCSGKVNISMLQMKAKEQQVITT